MSAPDAMPERVERYDNWCAATHGHELRKAAEGIWVLYTELDKMEKRALAAEARMAEVERERDALKQMLLYSPPDIERMQSDIAALTPMARLGVMTCEDELTIAQPGQVAAARSVLARREKEGA